MAGPIVWLTAVSTRLSYANAQPCARYKSHKNHYYLSYSVGFVSLSAGKIVWFQTYFSFKQQNQCTPCVNIRVCSVFALLFIRLLGALCCSRLFDCVHRTAIIVVESPLLLFLLFSIFFRISSYCTRLLCISNILGGRFSLPEMIISKCMFPLKVYLLYLFRGKALNDNTGKQGVILVKPLGRCYLSVWFMKSPVVEIHTLHAVCSR